MGGRSFWSKKSLPQRIMQGASRMMGGGGPTHHRDHSHGGPAGSYRPSGLLPGASPRTTHGHAHVRHPSWCGVDRFTLLSVCFVALLLYTFVLPHTPMAPAIAGWNDHGRQTLVLHEDAPAVAPAQLHRKSTPPLPSVATSRQHTPVGMSDAAPAADSFTLERILLLPRSPAFPQDSSAETLMLKPRRDKNLSHSYHVCTFTNVCVASDGVRFRFQNHTAWTEFEGLAKRCDNQAYYRANKICHCFHYGFRPQVLPYEFYAQITEPIKQIKARESSLNVAASREANGKPFKPLDSFSRRYADPFSFVSSSLHGHYWSSHKWVSHHHIAHWAQKLMMFQGIYQHHRVFEGELPPLDGIVFHDTSNTKPPLEDHLLSLFNISIESALAYRVPAQATAQAAAQAAATAISTDEGGDGSDDGLVWAHPNLWNGPDPQRQIERLLDPRSGRVLWAEDVVQQRYTTTLPPDSCADVDKCRVANSAYTAALKSAKTNKAAPLGADGRPIPARVTDPSLQTCFARLSMTPTYGLLTMDANDAQRFRAVTAARMELPDALQHPCPPRRAILLTRRDRRILNADAIRLHLKDRYNLALEFHGVSERNSSAEQVRLFATTGLVLSSHSSQLINVLFSHPSQALVEITPEFYNVDFAAYAHALGLSFHYALGGSIAKSAAEHPEHSADYQYRLDPLVIACVDGLRSTCPSGDSWCIAKYAPKLCGQISQWPNKQMNFFADLKAVEIAVQNAVAHIQDKCFGKW